MYLTLSLTIDLTCTLILSLRNYAIFFMISVPIGTSMLKGVSFDAAAY